jgi:hypothetical protein
VYQSQLPLQLVEGSAMRSEKFANLSIDIHGLHFFVPSVAVCRIACCNEDYFSWSTSRSGVTQRLSHSVSSRRKPGSIDSDGAMIC